MRTHPPLPRVRPPFWWAALVAAVLVAGGAFALTTPASAAPAGFAYRCGVHFCLDGKTFYFAGANTYDLFTYGGSWGDTETQYMDKARIDAHMADLRADKVQVVRTWMFSHEEWHGFEPTEGVYNEQQFALFDYVLKSAADHGIMVVPVFENYWEAYGGIDTRLQWEGLSGGHPGRAAFFDKTRCPGCFESYKNYVSHALNRTNHYTGVKYKDDPAIFAWELMNEPRYQGQSQEEDVNGTTLRKWVDEMGAFVKGIDPNHMLGAGIEGHGTEYGFGGDEGNPFVYIYQSPYIDYTTAHPYPTEEWADLDLEETKTLIRQWISDAHDVVGKPFYMSEFNVHNVDRTLWWNEIFAAFEAAGGDGTGFWWYQDHEVDGKFGVSSGDPELAAFRAHADRQAAKNGTGSPTPTPTPTTPTPTPTPPDPGAACAVAYRLDDWGGTFNGNVTIRNSGTTRIDGWTLEFSFPGNQQVTNAWNAKVTQNGKDVTAVDESWTAVIAPGGSVSFGFSGSSTAGTNGVPAAFTLNGTACAKG